MTLQRWKLPSKATNPGCMDLDSRYPAISDLRRRARQRIPHFVWEFLDSATGDEATTTRNRQALDQVLLRPSVLHGEISPDLTTKFLGRTYAAPFGIAPVGMSGLVWPNAERLLAQVAGEKNIPFGLSTVATQTPEDIGPISSGNGWFQLYPPRDLKILGSMLARIREAGFNTLVLTVDVPVASRRERQTRSGLRTPPKLTPRLLAQIVCCPAWAIGILKQGMPRMRFIDDFTSPAAGLSSTAHAGYLLRTSPDWDYLHHLREVWNGPLIVKGVLDPNTAIRLKSEGVDAIWVSNHAGRQFAAAPATIDALGPIRAALGDTYPLIMDSGIESGLDILRAFANGADFVMLGRAFHYGLGAFGKRGATHVVDILKADLTANMGQMGIIRLGEASNRLL